MNETIIELKNVSKTFGAVKAIDGLELSIERGQVYALLGHNGAGKTTTLRIILGLLQTDGGSVSVFGENPLNIGEKNRLKIGVLSEDTGLYEQLSIYENLRFFAEIFQCNKEFYEKQIDYYLKEFEIYDKKHSVIKDFSLGMKKKVAIIRTFLHQPDLILLDEPTNGLDPISIERFHKMVFDMSKRQGTTFILTTHNLDEVKKICDQISILRHGKNILTRNLKQDSAEDIFQTKISLLKPPSDIDSLIKIVDKDLHYSIKGNMISLGTSDKGLIGKIVCSLSASGHLIYEVTKDDFDLEKMYIQTEECS